MYIQPGVKMVGGDVMGGRFSRRSLKTAVIRVFLRLFDQLPTCLTMVLGCGDTSADEAGMLMLGQTAPLLLD